MLLHYAGHGFEIDGDNYLVPTGVTPASEPDIAEQLALEADNQPIDYEDRLIKLGHMRLEHVRAQSLRLNQLLGMVEQAAPTRILLFDACRDLPDMRSTTSSALQMANTGFAIAEGSAGTMIAFSAQPGQVASDGSGPVSPFMQAMLHHIDVRGIDINELMTRVRKDVHAYTKGDQVPWTHSALLEPFSFRPVPEGYYGEDKLARHQPEQQDQLAPSAAETEADEQHWQKIANSFDVEAYHGYLLTFPQGAHVEEAQLLLSKLGSLYDEGGASADAAAGAGIQIAANMGASRQFDASEQTPKRIVVLGDSDFVADRLPNAGDPTVGLPDALVDRIAANLARSPRFEVLERQALRRVISEQRFDHSLGESYLEKTFEQSFGDLRPNGGDVVIIPDNDLEVGSGIVAGSGLGSSAATADYLDLLKDFKDLGSSIGAEYLVFGRLESVDHEVQKRRIPYTERASVDETLNARLRLRVVDVEQAKIIGAVSLETEIEAEVFEGGASAVRSAMFERLAREVTGALADSFHQASVIQADPLVVDRGAIHGLQPDDTFTIERVGSKELVSQDGIKLGGHKTHVATVRVIMADDLWSEVEVIEGNQPALYDLARLDRDARTRPFEEDSVAKRTQSKPLKPGGKLNKNLPRLAVLPVHFTGSAQTSGLMATESGGGWEEPFAQSIAAVLHQSHRFEMLDRYDVDSFFDESDLAELASGTPVPEGLIDLEIADHLVLAEVSLLEFEKGQGGARPEGSGTGTPSSNRVDALAGLHAGTSRAYLEGVIRIADGRTGAWLEARQISIAHDIEADQSEARIISDLAKAFAAKAGLELINTVFPLKVASVTRDGTVYVNRGIDGGLEAGEVLTAYREGVEVVDPDSGITLGREERMVGQVTLTRVDDFSSIGTLADLNQPLAKNDHLRRQTWNRGKTSGGSQVLGVDSNGAGEAGAERSGQRVLALGNVEIADNGRFDLPPADLVPRFGQELANRLRESRRYVVAERQAFDEVIDEVYLNNMIEGPVGLPEALKAIDYIVLARLDNLLIGTDEEHVKLLDETFEKTKAVVELQVRMVDVRSFEQVVAETIRFERELDDGNDQRDQRLLLGDMLALAADEAVQRIMTVTFPVEIIGGGQGQWYVNRGADGGLSIGDSFAIYRQGEEMKDAAGISFGRAEKEVGRAMVVRVDSARSMIELQDISGDVSVGDILRPFKDPPLPAGWTAAPSSEAPASGAPASNVKTPKW